MLSEFLSIYPSNVHMTGDPVNSCFENGLLSWDMSCNILSKHVLFSDYVQSSSPSGSESDMIGNPVNSCFENGLLSWDMSNIFSKPILSSDHVQSASPSGSDNSNVSDNPISGSTVGNTLDDDVVNERKRKRRASNRESARRSRIRKQKHVENLKTELNRLKVANQELANGVHFVSNRTRILLAENNRLHAEHDMLRLVLSDMNQMLLLRKLQQAWPCNYNQIIH